MSQFDSSDEDNQSFDESLFQIDWLDLSSYEFAVELGLAGLPGCKFKDTWRSLKKDIDSIERAGVSDVFVLCTKGELTKYRVPTLLDDMMAAGLSVHHYPFPDGSVPTMTSLSKMLNEIKALVQKEKKVLIHCFGGLGRTCLVAVSLLLVLDSKITSDEAVERIKSL